MTKLSFLFVSLLSLPLESKAFSPVVRLPFAINGVSSRSPQLMAASEGKRRRRRKDAPSTLSAPASDELPDFEYDEYAEPAAAPAVKAEKPKSVKPPPVTSKSPPTPIKRGSGLNAQLAEELGGNVDGLDEDLILTTMRGQGEAWQPPRSIQDTLSDRRLEKFMDFDRMVEQDGNTEVVELPTMEEVISRRKQREAATAMQEGRVQDAAMLIDTEGMGKKAAKNAQRKAAALQREAEEEADKSPFDGLQGLNVLKLLENGAWVGIGLLCLWEVYINSPLFDRALPLIPVVYDDMPPGM